MTDPRVKGLAKVIVRYSLELQEGQTFLIGSGAATAFPFDGLTANAWNPMAAGGTHSGLESQAWAMSRIDVSRFPIVPFTGSAGSVVFPPASLVNPIFSTGSTGAAQYKPSFFRDVYDPPGTITCGIDDGHGPDQVPHIWPPR